MLKPSCLLLSLEFGIGFYDLVILLLELPFSIQNDHLLLLLCLKPLFFCFSVPKFNIVISLLEFLGIPSLILPLLGQNLLLNVFKVMQLLLLIFLDFLNHFFIKHFVCPLPLFLGSFHI